MTDLETACTRTDTLSFKKFRQSLCTGPLAKHLMGFNKPVVPKKLPAEKPDPKEPAVKKPKTPPQQKQPQAKPAREKAKPLTGEALKKVDLPAGLPQKNGKPDQVKYDKYPEGSLRKRLWDRMQERQCVRCASDKHVRSACDEKRQGCEDDFDTGPAFWISNNPKQARA